MIDALLSATRPASPIPVALGELVSWLAELPVPSGEAAIEPVVHGETAGVEVTGLSLSSQRIQPGDLYAALPGARTHGAAFAASAVSSGAVAILTDAEGAATAGDLGVPLVVVEAPRSVLGRLAARVYGEPATALRMIAVTGTQGKTTTTRLLEGGLDGAGVPAAAIGTVGTRVRGREVKTVLTTPEAPDLHGLFAVMREHDVVACAMEVSSHALVLGRVDGVVFDVAVFTNLGRDHLDFHTGVDEYFQAKASLFRPERARLGLVNIDDEYGRRLLLADSTIPMRTFSTKGAAADWRAEDIELSADGARFTVAGPDGVRILTGCPLPGDFNVANALAAVAAAAEAGFDPGPVAAAIAAGSGVPGRLEKVDAGQDFAAVVDYAHKPDAVEATLNTLRPLTEGQLIVVIGAGGDRDRGKRPVMGEIAGRLSDVVVVTDDNPRTENPAEIRAALLAGATDGKAEVLEVGDRRLAIREALRRARTGDIVLVAGKGHETGQEVGTTVHPFDDRDVVREELEGLGEGLSER